MLGLALALALTATTDDDDEPVELAFRPATSGPFIAFTAAVTPKRHLLLQPILVSNLYRGTFDELGGYSPMAPGTRFIASSLVLFTEVGIADDLALGAQGGGHHHDLQGPDNPSPFLGFVDTLFFLRMRVLHEAGWWPAVTSIMQVKLPTDATGNGATELAGGVNLTRHLEPFVFHLDVIYSRPFSALPGTFYWAFAAELPLLGHRFALMLELGGRHQLDDRVSELVLGVGVEWLLSPSVQLLLGYQRTMTGRGVPAFDGLTVTLVPTLAL